MVRLQIWLDQEPVGVLSHEGTTNRFEFEYLPGWTGNRRSFPLSPALPLERPPELADEAHSAAVRQFFENLLPEGDALDHAAQANGIAKSNLVGMVIALGKETTGAVRVTVIGDDNDPVAHAAGRHDGRHDGRVEPHPDDHDSLRLVTPHQLSQRIRDRAQVPFSVWDGRVRLSIAGYQDKVAFYEHEGQWFLVDGPRLASTVIVKPVPANPQLQALPDVEHMCMLLAKRSGLWVAGTRLIHVPQPVLLVDRFDRIEADGRVQRLHIIDGCQALGLSVSMKYERPYGDSRDVKDIRDGVTYAKLFGLLDQGTQPALEKRALLRWVIYQILIGNTDAHGKNVSFFCSVAGLRLAPAYDLVSTLALGWDEKSAYAMAIGDAFAESELTPFEWAGFAKDCGLPIKLVAMELRRLAVRVRDELPQVLDTARAAGASDKATRAVSDIVEARCVRWVEQSPAIAKVRDGDLG
jgi:serine/threonine-protein kinase HipA